MEFGIFAKTQGILYAHVVYSLILKIKDIAIFAAKIHCQGKHMEFGFFFQNTGNFVCSCSKFPNSKDQRLLPYCHKYLLRK